MKIVLEKIRDSEGNLRDVVRIPTNETFRFERAGPNNLGYTWVQWIDGRPVEAFTDKQILVIEID